MPLENVQLTQNHITVPTSLSNFPSVCCVLWSSFQTCFIFFTCCQLSVNPKFFLTAKHKRASVLILVYLSSKSGVWQLFSVITSVPERAEFTFSQSFSGLLFRLHFAVPDLKVAVVLIRETLCFPGPERQRNRKSFWFWKAVSSKQETIWVVLSSGAES